MPRCFIRRFIAALAGALALAVGLSGCVHGPPGVTREALLLGSAGGERGRAWPQPRMSATVEGEPVELLVDTGTQLNLISEAFLRRHNVFADHSVDMYGGAGALTVGAVQGRAVPVRIARDVQVRFPNGGEGALSFVSTPGALLGDPELVGVLSPQVLRGPGQALVIDLAGHLLWSGSEAAALGWLRGAYPSAVRSSAAACHAGVDGISAELVNVEASVDGRPRPLLLDTGAAATLLFVDAAQGGDRPLVTVSGRVDSTVGGPVLLSVGGTRLQLRPLLTGEHPPCGSSEGVLGMDVLQRCAVVWTDGGVWLGCKG